MRVEKIEIKNFRSLESVEINVSDFIVILGKNNEGKSNVLKSINRFDSLIDYFISRKERFIKDKSLHLMEGYFRPESIEADVPLSIRNLKRTSKNISIGIIFSLTEQEQEELNSIKFSGTKTNGYLEINFTYTRDLVASISVKLREDVKAIRSSEKVIEILNFYRNNFNIRYIPTIRTEDNANEIIRRILSERLETLNSNPEYINAINRAQNIQSDLLSEIAEEIKPDLVQYIPEIKNIKIQSKRTLQRLLSSNVDIFLDDGKDTNLADKGDGIKSLVVMSLLSSIDTGSCLLLVDEPESHLHSKAIRELQNKLKTIPNNNQIILASHHQIFVNRNHIEKNYILSRGKVLPNTSIKKIRDELGVSLGENLLNAEYVILVEGETDKKILLKYIKDTNNKLHRAIHDDRLVIDSLGGVKHFLSKYNYYVQSLCKLAIILDNDKIVEDVLSKYEIEKSNVYRVPKNGKNESEFEDLLNEEFLFKEVDKTWGLDNSISRKNKDVQKKFTDKLRGILDSYGKSMGKVEEEEFKWRLVRSIEIEAIENYTTETLKGFIDPILNKIQVELFGEK
ncbi:TPA: ATP-dependent endonuclease [Streptococcus suis]